METTRSLNRTSKASLTSTNCLSYETRSTTVKNRGSAELKASQQYILKTHQMSYLLLIAVILLLNILHSVKLLKKNEIYSSLVCVGVILKHYLHQL